MVQDLDERVLRQVFGGRAFTHHAKDERKHRPFITAHKLAKSRLAPFLGETGDVCIGEVGEVES